MNLKTSLFSKALVKSDIKRYWWVSVLYMVLSALFILPNAVTKEPDYIYTSFASDSGALALVFAFALGGLLFSYLHRVNSVSFMNSIPVSRTKQYLSHILSGFILLIIPITITSVVIFFEELHFGCGINFCYKYFYLCLLYAACAFMLTTFTSVLSGNLIAVYIFGGGFVILPYFLLIMANEIFSQNVYGFVEYGYDIMQYIYIMGMYTMWAKRSVIYIAIAGILFIVSLVLYNMRNMENYGEIVAFKPLKPILMYFMAVCFGIFGYAILDDLHSNINFTLGVLPLGIIALIAVFMLNQKSFSLKGVLKPVVIFVVCTGIVNANFAFDFTGYEKRVPDVSSIENIDAFNSIYDGIYSNAYDNSSYLNSNSPDYDTVKYKGIITDQKDINSIVELHKYLIQRGYKDTYGPSSQSFNITYTLKNNKKIKRHYNIFPDEMKNIYAMPNYKKVRYSFTNDNKKKIYNAQIHDSILTNSSKDINDVALNNLGDAIKKDVDSLTPDNFVSMDSGMDNGMILTIYYTEYINYKGKTYPYNVTEDIHLNSYFKNVNKLLSEYINTSDYFPIENIHNLDIDYSLMTDEANPNNVKIDNKEDITAIMNAIYDIDYIDSNDSSTQLYYLSIFSSDLVSNDRNGYIQVTLPSNEISPNLKKYFKN